MSNYYTQFAFTLPQGGSTVSIEQWVNGYRDLIDRRLSEEDKDWYEQYGGIEVTFLKDHGVAYIQDDGGAGNVDAAEHAIRNYLQHFPFFSNEAVYFGWSNFGDKSGDNDNSGGGMVVSRDDVWIVGSYDAVNRAMEEGFKVLN